MSGASRSPNADQPKVGAKARVIASLVLALLLPACGFQPLYGTTDIAAGARAPGALLSSIYVEPIPERVGYRLRNDLLDLFNANARAENAPYKLKLTLRERKDAVALQTNASITRYNYSLIARYELTPAGAAAPVRSGEVSALSAYNVATSPFATVIAERDASDRAANDIAERIRTELAVYFRETNGGIQ